MTLDKIIISSCDRYTYWSKHQVDSGPLCHHGQGYSCCQKSMLHWVPMFPLPQRGSIVTIGEMPSLVLMILIVRVNTHTLSEGSRNKIKQIILGFPVNPFFYRHNTIWYQTFSFHSQNDCDEITWLPKFTNHFFSAICKL